LIVDAQGRSGIDNMAADEALLEDALQSGRAFLRLYRWDPPTLSVGRNQSIQRLVGDDIPVVRRPTGGQAVWHEHEVTYAVAAPVAMFGSLRNAYRDIHARIATALRSLGVDAVLASPPAVRPSRESRPAACFAVSVGGEILVQDRKLVGSAQVRRGHAFLQHGSILIDGAQPSSFNGETTLRALLGRSVSFGEVADAITKTWCAAGRPTSDVASLAAE
jgi:lipoyl(octanoyl) transferase